MLKTLLIFFSLIFFVNTAKSNELDFSTMSCGEYLYLIERLTTNKNMNAASGILMWLYGFASNQSNVTVFTNEKFRTFANTLGEQCTLNKKEQLLTIVKKIGVN